MREIVGTMELRDMVSNRQKFADKVKENAAPDLAKMGLDVVSFNVQNFTDSQGVIDNLGIDNISKIQKDNMFFGDNVADRNLYELIAMYILLATQIKYDVTGIIVSPEKWYEMRMNDYEINREKMRLANNNVVKMFELNKRFYIKKIR